LEALRVVRQYLMTPDKQHPLNDTVEIITIYHYCRNIKSLQFLITIMRNCMIFQSSTFTIFIEAHVIKMPRAYFSPVVWHPQLIFSAYPDIIYPEFPNVKRFIRNSIEEINK